MEFKKLSDVALQDSATETTNVYIEENGETKRISASKLGGGAGVSSWNDLTDRPFGEELVSVGDTLECNNPAGFESCEYFGDTYYRISPNVPSLDDLTNGIIDSNNDYNITPLEEIQDMLEQFGMFETSSAIFIPTDNFVVEDNIIPKAGIWIYQPCEIVIPGYNISIFQINQIDPKFIPQKESLHVDVRSNSELAENPDPFTASLYPRTQYEVLNAYFNGINLELNFHHRINDWQFHYVDLKYVFSNDTTGEYVFDGFYLEETSSGNVQQHHYAIFLTGEESTDCRLKEYIIGD